MLNNLKVAKWPWLIVEEYNASDLYGEYIDKSVGGQKDFSTLESRTRNSILNVTNQQASMFFNGTIAQGFENDQVSLYIPNCGSETSLPCPTTQFLNDNGILKPNPNWAVGESTSDNEEFHYLNEFQQEQLKKAQISYIDAQLSGYRPYYDLKTSISSTNGSGNNTSQSSYEYANDFDSLPRETKMYLRSIMLTKTLSDNNYKLQISPEDYVKLELLYEKIIKLTKDDYAIIRSGLVNWETQLDFNLGVLQIIDEIIIGIVGTDSLGVSNPEEEMLNPNPISETNGLTKKSRNIEDGNVQQLANIQFKEKIESHTNILDKNSIDIGENTTNIEENRTAIVVVDNKAEANSGNIVAINEKLNASSEKLLKSNSSNKSVEGGVWTAIYFNTASPNDFTNIMIQNGNIVILEDDPSDTNKKELNWRLNINLEFFLERINIRAFNASTGQPLGEGVEITILENGQAVLIVDDFLFNQQGIYQLQVQGETPFSVSASWLELLQFSGGGAGGLVESSGVLDDVGAKPNNGLNVRLQNYSADIISNRGNIETNKTGIETNKTDIGKKVNSILEDETILTYGSDGEGTMRTVSDSIIFEDIDSGKIMDISSSGVSFNDPTASAFLFNVASTQRKVVYTGLFNDMFDVATYADVGAAIYRQEEDKTKNKDLSKKSLMKIVIKKMIKTNKEMADFRKLYIEVKEEIDNE